MGTNDQHSPSGWTIDTLHEHLGGQICSVDRRHSELAEAREKAVDVAIKAADEKAKSHNDLLQTMKDQQGLFFTKEQAVALADRLDKLEKLQVAEAAKDKTIGVSAGVIMQLLTAATLVIAIIVFFANR